MAKAPAIVWEGAEALRPLLRPIDEPTPWPGNPRRGNLEEVAKSLQRFGQLRAILIWSEKGWIVAGNHTRRAAAELCGWTHVACQDVDLAQDEAEAFLIADNRTSDLADYENDLLLPLLSKIEERGQLEGTGWTIDQLEDHRAQLNRIAEAERAATQAAHAETDDEIEARREMRASSRVMREVVLSFDEDRYAEFGNFVRMLAREYGTAGVIDTVFEAVKKQAATL